MYGELALVPVNERMVRNDVKEVRRPHCVKSVVRKRAAE